MRNCVEVGNVLYSGKPQIIATVDRVLLICVLVLSYRALQSADRDAQFRRIWPCIIIAVSFVSPLTWTYHYLTAAVFLPLLVESHGRAGKWHLAVLFAIFCIWTLVALDGIRTFVLIPQLLGTVGIVYMFVLLLRPTWHRKAEPLPVSA